MGCSNGRLRDWNYYEAAKAIDKLSGGVVWEYVEETSGTSNNKAWGPGPRTHRIRLISDTAFTYTVGSAFAHEVRNGFYHKDGAEMFFQIKSVHYRVAHQHYENSMADAEARAQTGIYTVHVAGQVRYYCFGKESWKCTVKTDEDLPDYVIRPDPSETRSWREPNMASIVEAKDKVTDANVFIAPVRVMRFTGLRSRLEDTMMVQRLELNLSNAEATEECIITKTSDELKFSKLKLSDVEADPDANNSMKDEPPAIAALLSTESKSLSGTTVTSKQVVGNTSAEYREQQSLVKSLNNNKSAGVKYGTASRSRLFDSVERASDKDKEKRRAEKAAEEKKKIKLAVNKKMLHK